MIRVVGEPVGVFVPGRLRAQGAVAEYRVGLAARMQKPRLPFGIRQRPGVGIPPAVHPHQEQPQRRLPLDTVVDAAQPALEPAQLFGLQIDERVLAKVDVAGSCRRSQGVRPGTDDELALPRLVRAAFEAQTVEVGERLIGIEVVPTPHVEGRHPDLLPSAGIVHRLPVVVIGRVGNPVAPEREVPARGGVDVLQR